VALGFVLPAGYLIREVVARGLLVGFDTALIGHAMTTIGLAASATAVTLMLGFLAVAALRYADHPVIRACVSTAGIGYALPGTVLALGLLAPLVLVDDVINALAAAFGRQRVGLVLAGSAAALVIAYVIRYLAIAIGFAQAGFARISRELDEVARMSGAGPGTMARTIHLPLARPAILGAARWLTSTVRSAPLPGKPTTATWLSRLVGRAYGRTTLLASTPIFFSPPRTTLSSLRMRSSRQRRACMRRAMSLVSCLGRSLPVDIVSWRRSASRARASTRECARIRRSWPERPCRCLAAG
jgi:ABC-type molybdate transport system permease subunit